MFCIHLPNHAFLVFSDLGNWQLQLWLVNDTMLLIGIVNGWFWAWSSFQGETTMQNSLRWFVIYGALIGVSSLSRESTNWWVGLVDLEACVWLKETLKKFECIPRWWCYTLRIFFNGVCTNIIHVCKINNSSSTYEIMINIAKHE